MPAYLVTMVSPERGRNEAETTIVIADDKTEATYKAHAKLRRAIGKSAKTYACWSVKELQTTF